MRRHHSGAGYEALQRPRPPGQLRAGAAERQSKPRIIAITGTFPLALPQCCYRSSRDQGPFPSALATQLHGQV